MAYYETQVIFTEEIQTKTSVREKKTRRNFLVECDAVSVAEAKVSEHLKDSPYPFEVKVVKESKIVGVID
jgi:hypothetical protein|tara:strand:- start:354 stop:563 length:210 start_codon:yes stop_codon:yes gene_type:complete